MISLYTEDAIQWLRSQPNYSIGNIVTGLPDMAETHLGKLDDYIRFLRNVATLIFQKVKKDGYCIFINTDRKYKGTWVDKSYHIQDVAYRHGIDLKWHKIVVFRKGIDLHRPTYCHYLNFSFHGKPGKASPDILDCGHKEYKNATSENAYRNAIDFLNTNSLYKMVCDPFVGRGAMLLYAKQTYNFDVIGIDIDPNQVKVTKERFATTG